jgi:hypothetical protein
MVPSGDFARKEPVIAGCHQSDLNLILGHTLEHLADAKIRDLATERTSYVGRQLLARKSEPGCGDQIVVAELPESRDIGEIGEPSLS